MTRASKSLIVSFFAFGMICIAGVATLHSTRFHNFLFSLLGRGTGWKITALKSEIHILRGVVILRGFDAKDSKERIHIAGDRVLLDLSSFSLIRGKIIVTDLELDHPLIDVSKIPPPAGPTPDFLTILLPDVMNTLFKHFDQSVILQNLVLDHVVLHDFVLLRYGGKTATFQNASFHIATNLFREIELGMHLEDAGGLLPSLQSADLDLTLSKSGLKLKKAEIDLRKIQLSVTGDWKGTLEKGALKADGKLQAPIVLSEPLQFGIDMTVEKGIATIKRLNAQLGEATFEGKGSFHIANRNYELAFTAKNLALESIFSKIRSPVLGPAKGMASVEGKAAGQLPNLEAKAKATIEDLRHGAMHASRVEGTLNFHWPELDWDADIKPGGGQAQGHAKGGVAFKILANPEYEGKRKTVLKDLELNFQDGSLKDLLPTLDVSGKLNGLLNLKGVEGTLSVAGKGHAKVTEGHWFLGGIDLLESDIAFQPKGKIVFTGTDIRIPDWAPLSWPQTITLDTSGESVLFSGDPMQGFSVKGRYEKESGYFKIENFEIRKNGSELRGSLGLRKGGSTDGHVSGTANLEGLALFPAYFREARGLAKLDLSMYGSTKDPNLKGHVELLGDELDLRGYSGITNLTGIVTVDGPWYSPQLTGYLGDGKFDLKGRIRTEHFIPQEFNIALKGTNLSLSRPNLYHIDFDADVTLNGRLPSPKLEGKVDIVDGRYVKPFVVRELVLKPFEEPSEADSFQKKLDALVLNLRIRNSGDLRIRNNIADLLLQSDLLVEGTFGRPKISGALTASEGTVEFLGESFTLNEGRLDFIDPAKKEPFLRLQAQQDIPPDYVVYADVKGFLSNLDVVLTSNPPLPREDIISLLTTGLTQEQFRQSGQSRKSLGTGMLAGEITGLVERQVSKRTGLDVFRLEASESGNLSKVSIGKNVTDRLTLEFQNDFAPQTAERTIQANYYLTDNILLKGYQAWQAGSSPRFNFNVSFRFRLY